MHKAATAAASANMKVKILTRDSLSHHVRNATQVASCKQQHNLGAAIGGQAADQGRLLGLAYGAGNSFEVLPANL
jgi:hypothetical protein